MSDIEERLARLLQEKSTEVEDSPTEPAAGVLRRVRSRRRRAMGGAALAVIASGGLVAVMLHSRGDRSSVTTVAPPRVADCKPADLEPWIAKDIRLQVTNTLAPGATRPATAQFVK